MLSLQVLRWTVADPYVLYALFTSYDMSIHLDMNAVHDTLQVALDIVKVGALARTTRSGWEVGKQACLAALQEACHHSCAFTLLGVTCCNADLLRCALVVTLSSSVPNHVNYMTRLIARDCACCGFWRVFWISYGSCCYCQCKKEQHTTKSQKIAPQHSLL